MFCKNGIANKPDFTKVMNKNEVLLTVVACFQNNYKVTRGNYGFLDENHITFFRDLLGEQRIVTDLSDLEKYNVDYHEHLRGNYHLYKEVYCLGSKKRKFFLQTVYNNTYIVWITFFNYINSKVKSFCFLSVQRVVK